MLNLERDLADRCRVRFFAETDSASIGEVVFFAKRTLHRSASSFFPRFGLCIDRRGRFFAKRTLRRSASSFPATCVVDGVWEEKLGVEAKEEIAELRKKILCIGDVIQLVAGLVAEKEAAGSAEGAGPA